MLEGRFRVELRLSSTLDRPVNPIQDSVPQLVNRAYQPANVDTVGFVAGDAIKIKEYADRDCKKVSTRAA